MTAPTQQPADLEQRIAEALTEVRGAEAAAVHCPSNDNLEMVELTWYRLDRLIDRLPREQEAAS